MDEQWFHDGTENVYYRVSRFEHHTKRVMEEWLSSTGESWYLDPGLTRLIFLQDHTLTPCDPIPGMLSR